MIFSCSQFLSMGESINAFKKRRHCLVRFVWFIRQRIRQSNCDRTRSNDGQIIDIDKHHLNQYTLCVLTSINPSYRRKKTRSIQRVWCRMGVRLWVLRGVVCYCINTSLECQLFFQLIFPISKFLHQMGAAHFTKIICHTINNARF